MTNTLGTSQGQPPMAEAAPTAHEAPFRTPRLGEPAIPFRVRTTMGERNLADYRGRWLLLFSHPADFTPVCTSEFIAFARAHGRFRALSCELLGLSVDSLFAHLAWVRSIEAELSVTIPFPIAEDISMAMARAYGMIHPGDASTATVRGSFLIDPAGVIRMLAYYPMTTGRSIEELLRTLSALQESDASGVSTPADWKPGEEGVLPPPLTVQDAEARKAGGAPAWYYQPQAGAKR
ncbi:1-Cys peroxiredoxin [Belnapia rosea]|uniref:Peroxiredoxin n=2 Tax=Belnapia rosea TaxID=938405 RepID=A0A1G7DCB1_9PROT|nr:1-Cys peroxiredoxin [Belnapia rosea]